MSEFDTQNTPASGDTGAPAQAPTQPAYAPQPATQVAPQAPASGVPSEDRSNWVPPYRIREAREAAVRQANEQFAQRESQIRQEADRYRQQLHQLVGVNPPGDPAVDNVRQQFAYLYPGLAKLESRYGDIEKVMERAGDYDSQLSHYWQSYGQNALDRLFTHAQTSIGSPLTDEGKRQLHSAFVGFVSSSPEMEDRYSRDPKFVEDFWKAFSTSFIDPVRRSTSAGVVGRTAVNLPQDTPGGAPRTTPAPAPQNLNERAAQAWALYQQSADPNAR